MLSTESRNVVTEAALARVGELQALKVEQLFDRDVYLRELYLFSFTCPQLQGW